MRTYLALLCSLAACSSSARIGDGDDDVVEPDACEVVDCADPACAEVFECTWPTRLDLVSDVDFAGATIDCFIPIDVDDCVTDATASLEPVTEGGCPACDRTYAGPLDYERDTCSDLAGFELPTEARVGVVFVSETEREIWSVDDAGEWTRSAEVTGQDGVFVVSSTEDVEVDIEECRQGVQKVGTLTAVLTFTDGG